MNHDGENAAPVWRGARLEEGLWMRSSGHNGLTRLFDLALTVAAAFIARFRRGESLDAVEARLRALPPRGQAMAVGGTLGLVFIAALLAAQAGLVGMAIFFVAVILIVG
jgi:hypothetical protein